MKLYREDILDHARHPRRFGDLPDKTNEARETNSSCGDMVEVYLNIEKGVVKDAGFRGVGCALSTASGSMLMEELIGKKVEEIVKWNDKKIFAMMGEINLARVKCVMLPLMAIMKAIKK